MVNLFLTQWLSLRVLVGGFRDCDWRLCLPEAFPGGAWERQKPLQSACADFVCVAAGFNLPIFMCSGRF